MANPILDMLKGSMSQRPQNQQGFPTSLDDPRMKQAVDYVNNHGGNPKQAFYQLCKEKMMNPEAILKAVMGGK